MRFSPLAYKILKNIRFYQLENQEFYLLVSGGRDSMVALSAFLEIQKGTDIAIKVLHIHHGQGNNQEFRDKAKTLVKDFCEKESLEFFTNQGLPENLTNEEEMRNFRKEVIEGYRKEGRIMVQAHHQEDLLETRLMRLIRGTGPEGLIAMNIWQKPYFRPFLETSLKEIQLYQKEKEIPYLEDPSNKDISYFRNWLRHIWLPQIDETNFGSTSSFAQSLETLAQVWQEKKKDYKKWFQGSSLDRNFLLNLDFSHQLQVLALFLQENGIYHFQRSQLEEILKLLDNRQKSYTFKMLQVNWQISHSEIQISASA